MPPPPWASGREGAVRPAWPPVRSRELVSEAWPVEAAPLMETLAARMLGVLLEAHASSEAARLPWPALALTANIRALRELVFALEAEHESLHSGMLRDSVLRRVRRALFPAGRT